MTPYILNDLSMSDFRHPLEASSLKTLQDTRGLDRVVKKFYDMGLEKIIKLRYTGSCLQLTQESFPELHQLISISCEVLGVVQHPQLYVQRSDQFTATTIGMDQPIIILSSECIDKLTKAELLFMIGREVTNIKSNLIHYQEIGSIFPELMDALSGITLGLSGILSTGLKYALFQWVQMAQYTADRGGLLVCQETYTVKQLFSKLAGLPEKYWAVFQVEDLEEQARLFEGVSTKTFDNFIRFLYGNNLWAIARANEIFKWLESGEYNQIITRKGQSRVS